MPATDDTRGLVDAEFLGRMRPARSCSTPPRGEVVDEGALLEALDAGAVRAGLDVYADEPGKGQDDWDSKLARHPNVVGTHHIGASTEQAQAATADGVVEIVDAFTEGQARSCVNLAPSRLGSATLTVRHLDRPGVLAKVLDLLSVARLNVEHMENRVFRGGEAAIASIDVAGSAHPGPARRAARGPPCARCLGDLLRRSRMTSDPGTGRASGADVVRPLRARLVQQDRVAEKVFPMLDALPASERTSLPDCAVGPVATDHPRRVRRRGRRALRLPAAPR